MISNLSTESPEIKELFKLALLARENAYAPYSKYKVGAAIRTVHGTLYSGCNIENSSYGATNCAERVAIQKAVSEQGVSEIIEIMVVTEADPPWPPCGMCRQVISEFSKSCKIYLANPAGRIDTLEFEELFPQAFTPAHLLTSGGEDLE